MTFKKRRIATLDLGTNSLLLLVAERDENGKITVLADESLMPRLGEGLRATGAIAPHVSSRACEAIETFVQKAHEMQADEICLTATSATREAKNREEFVSAVEEAAGILPEVLPPNEEARLTYLSATMESPEEIPTLVADIGGGSTEVSWGLGHRFDGGRSMPIGTVKLLEGPLQGDPPPPEGIEAARREIDRALSRITPLGRFDRYVGTAGSFTHLAGVDLHLNRYHSEKVFGHRLTRTRVEEWAKRLARMTVKERLELPGIDPRRADVILAGTLMIEGLFRKFKNDAFEVVDRGIRFGKLFDRLRNFHPPLRFP